MSSQDFEASMRRLSFMDTSGDDGGGLADDLPPPYEPGTTHISDEDPVNNAGENALPSSVCCVPCSFSFFPFSLSLALVAQGNNALALRPPPPMPSRGDVGKAHRRLLQAQATMRRMIREYRLREQSVQIAVFQHQQAEQRYVLAQQEAEQSVMKGGFGKQRKKQKCETFFLYFFLSFFLPFLLFFFLRSFQAS
jgi:hypothetical protein